MTTGHIFLCNGVTPAISSMNTALTCRQCGTALESDAYAGLCPLCLVQVGIDLSANAGSESASLAPTDIPEVLPRQFGDYELLERIGRGGMGLVYKARQISLNRVVAVKMLLTGELASRETLLRFRAEAESSADLRHPNILPIFETGEADGQHYFSMEYIDGPDLAEIVRDGPMAANRGARYVEAIARAIEYAHEHGILHRDLKPSNVLIDEHDQPRVMDFGLAKKLSPDSALTLSGQLLGSPNFMPPEQASSKRGKVGRHSDVYGLGALLYHLLTGRPPFQAATLEETLQQVFEVEPVSPRTLVPSVPRDLETICLKCLAKEPGHRYLTAEAVAEELGRFQRGEPIHARPVRWVGKTWRWCRRKPLVAGLAASVALLLLVLAIGGPIVATRQSVLAQRNLQLAEQTRELAYAYDLAAAWQSWDIGKITRAIDLLERHRPEPGQRDLREFTWRYLWNLCLPAVESPRAENPVPVFLSAVSPDGSLLATSGAWGNVTIWNVATRTIERQLSTGERFAGALAFSPDGRQLVSTGGYLPLGSTGTLQVWDVATDANLFQAEFGGHAGAFSPPDGRWFAVAKWNTIAVLDVEENWEVARRWEVDPPGIWNLRWSPDGTQLVSAGKGHTAAIWDAASGEKQIALQGHEGEVRSAVFSPDGHLVVTVSEDKTVRFWDVASGAELEDERYAHAAEVEGLAWSRYGNWVASASDDGLVKLRNRTTKSEWTLRGHSQGVKPIQFAQNDATLITGSLDSTILFWDLAELPPNDTLEGRNGSLSPVAFSPESRIVATVSAEPSHILLWEVATGTEESRFSISKSNLRALFPPTEAEATVTRIAVDDLAFVSENQLAAACAIQFDSAGTETWRHRVALLDLPSGAVVEGFPGRAPLRLSRQGQRLVMQSEDVGVQVRDLESGSMWPEPGGEMEGVPAWERLFALAVSPDGNHFAANGPTGTGVDSSVDLALVEVETGKWLTRLVSRPLETPIHAMTFTPDGQRLITAGFDPKIQVWDVRSLQLEFEMPGHTAAVRSMAISPDGKTLVSGSRTGVIKFWSMEQKVELLTIRPYESDVRSLRFSPDGNTLASSDKEGHVRLWRAVPE